MIREISSTFEGWQNRPFVTAALVRSVATAHKALKDGADGIIIFWPIFKEMIQNKFTDEWNKTFLDHWNGIYDAGNLDDLEKCYDEIINFINNKISKLDCSYDRTIIEKHVEKLRN